MRRISVVAAAILAVSFGAGLAAHPPLRGEVRRPPAHRGERIGALAARGPYAPAILPRGGNGRAAQAESAGSMSADPSPQNISCTGAPTLVFGTATTATLSASSSQLNWTGCFGTTYQWPGGEKVFVINTAGMGTRDLRVSLSNIPSGKDPDLFLLTSCLSGSCVAFGDNTLVVPDLPEGSYYLVLDDYNGQFSYSCTVTAYAATGTLLVDADGSNLGAGYPNVGGAYGTALTNLGYAYTSLELTTNASNSPSAATLAGYKRVVWVTGQYDGLNGTRGKVLTDAQATAFQTLVDSGGELLLVSQGYLREASGGLDVKMGESTFAYQYLQVSAVTNDMSSYLLNLTGENGDGIGDDGDLLTPPTSVTFSASSPVASNPVGMDTMFGTPSFRADNGKAGVLWYDGALAGGDSSKLVFASFPLENASSSAQFETVLMRALEFMDNYTYAPVSTGAGFVDGAVANGIPDPGETIGIEFILQNDDSKTHTAQAYLVMHDPFFSPEKDNADLGTLAANTCTPSPACRQASTTFNIDVAAGCPVGHRAEFTINYWLDGSWYDGPSFGLWVGQAKVFLVKDEQVYPNTSPALVAYKNALNGAAVSYAEYDTAFYGSPWYNDTSYMSNTNMISYGSVVWATGSDFAYTLLPYTSSTLATDSSDEREIQLLLRGGGRLFLCSQDYFYDYFGGTSCNPSCAVNTTRPFPRDDLGIATVKQEAYSGVDTTATAQSGEDVSSGMSFALVNNLSIPNYCDEVATKAVSPYPVPRSLFNYPDGKAGALIYEGLVYGGSVSARLATFLFPFENLDEGADFNSKTLLMKRLLYWFDFGDKKSASYSYPADATLTWGVHPVTGAPAWNWTAVTVNRAGQTIPTHYHIYRGTSPTGLAKDSLEYTRNYLVDAATPSAGQCLYYRVRVSDILEIEGPDTP